ncbi:hypothetical protein HBI04_193250 [Parastagonospora nodorum]|nr:hypothetical protein HBI03_202440 [Parastagonospora nodorum]KAH4263338.1 hypothetical protein HBI04_193250 [Parastagonospora nodorum]KAH5068669.1 hypothetical protein HBH95_190650 [Parastagonospora nodorum]KAH5337465.1 hypothetical protein HBI50_022370 [Parastagonospora nodorum]KAH5461403.1 hypothetical protein HBI30_016640 [Parastagonospora nodorum]
MPRCTPPRRRRQLHSSHASTLRCPPVEEILSLRQGCYSFACSIGQCQTFSMSNDDRRPDKVCGMRFRQHHAILWGPECGVIKAWCISARDNPTSLNLTDVVLPDRIFLHV